MGWEYSKILKKGKISRLKKDVYFNPITGKFTQKYIIVRRPKLATRAWGKLIDFGEDPYTKSFRSRKLALKKFMNIEKSKKFKRRYKEIPWYD